MKRTAKFLGILSLLPVAAAQTNSDMLERTLPGVLTVAINEMSQTKKPMGAAAGSERFNKAYDRVLDLSDAKGTGSGFLIQRGGRSFVVTNAHVVEMAEPGEIYAYSINQTRYKLKPYGGDSFYDLALLEFVEPDKPGPELTPMIFRSEDARIGETVFALGNPLGEYPYSVTQGIVGGRNRQLSGLTGRLGYLQHSAGTIWGNSGGPLVDTNGRVAGVNTRIEIKDRGQAFLIASLNFALQSSTAQRVIEGLLQNKGRLNRAYLGLELTQTLAVNQFRKLVTAETVIDSVVPNGPASALAKYKGYRVDRIGSQAVRNLDEALAATEALMPGQTVEFELTKGGASETVQVKTGQLTEANYVALANHVIRSRSDYELVQQDGHVYLQHQQKGPARPASSMQIVPISSAPKETIAQVPQFAGIVAAGLVPERRGNNQSEPQLYRVNTILDMGVALRLLLMGGGADLVVVPPSSAEPAVIRWTLSTDSNVAVRMLIS